MTARDLEEIARNKKEMEVARKDEEFEKAALGPTKSVLTSMGWMLLLIGVNGVCMGASICVCT